MGAHTGSIGTRARARVSFSVAALLTATVVALAGLWAPSPAAAASLISSFQAGVVNTTSPSDPPTSGQYATQAGSHPAEALTQFTVNTSLFNSLQDVRVDLPPGLVVNPQAIPQCNVTGSGLGACPSDTEVGQSSVTIINVPIFGNVQATGNVYNMVPPAGSPGDFAFSVTIAGLITIRTDLVAGVRWYPSNGQPADYGDYFTISGISNLLGTALQTSTLAFWGAPEEQNGGGATDNAFITNPTACNGPQTSNMYADTYTSGQTGTDSFTTPTGATGCTSIPFNPSVTVTPSTTQRDQPDGITVDMSVPQDENPAHIAPSQLENTTITLPAGLSINPSAGNGLQACTSTQFGEGTNAAIACPTASEVGSATLTSPALAGTLTGSIYVGPQTNNTYQVYVDAANTNDGVDVRLTGTVTANTSTGQLTATFDNTPQVPFSDFKLQFNTGSGALFANSLACGAAATTTSLVPYSGNPAATPSSSFTVDQNGSMGTCAPTVPFTPTASAVLSSTTAGANPTLTLNVARSDGTQTLSTVSTQLPPGLLANISTVTPCTEPAATNGTCGAASQIGTTTVSAGAGSTPLSLPGTVYLTAAYNGAPFGLSIVVPAIVGPFNLGTVVVRAAVNVNTATGVVSITTDPLPTILQGVPLRLKTIVVTINKAGFLTNPTSCAAGSITGAITSTAADNSPFTSPATMTGCASLPAFSPTITATPGTTQRDKPTGLDVDVHLASGLSDLQSAMVTLPAGMSINPSVANVLGSAACTSVEFNADSCPAASAVGTAEIDTPLVSTPFTGSVYVGSQAGNVYTLYVWVQDATDGLEVHLTGTATANTSTGQITTSFPSAPPIPFTDLKLDFTGGADALLANAQTCGTATTSGTLTPTSGQAAASPTSAFTVDNNGSGGACPGTLPFGPTATTMLGTTAAGASDTLTLTAARSDGDQTLSTIAATLPPGMLANLASTPLCNNANANAGTCAASSQIGTTTVTAGAGTNPFALTGQVYLTTSYNGEPFGLSIVVPAIAGPYNLGTVVVRGAVGVNTTTGQVSITTDPLPTILDGIPLRLRNVGVTINAANFLTNPTSCSAQALTGTITSTGSATSPINDPLTMTNCASVAFAPTITATPGTTKRDAPTGLNVDLHLPLGNSDLQSASVVLPAGMSINPSVANVLGSAACTPAEFDADTCPAASEVGTAEIDTPLLSNVFTGFVYVGAQSGNSYTLFVWVQDVTDSLEVHLTGTATANTSTGQITASFPSAPPIPFSDLKLDFNGGANALLANSQACGTATTSSVLTPNSGGSNATPTSAFTVDNNGSGGACPGTLPFGPTTTSTPGNTVAGAYDTLGLSAIRSDGDQTLSTISAQLPPGMLANLNSIPQCSSANASAGTCAAGSQIGLAAVTAGAGTNPYLLVGPVYLTAAYKGAPLGLEIAVNAESVGPYNFGMVLVRAAVNVDTTTGQVTITTDPLPTILDGVPLRLRSVLVTITAANFLVNPTTCATQAVTGTIGSTGSATTGINDPLTMTGCAALPFNPSLTVTPSSTRRDTPTGVDIDLQIPANSSALQSASVKLPAGLAINPSAANGVTAACTAAQFAAGTSNPVTCPAGSVVGTVTISSPLVTAAFTGDVYVGPQSGNTYQLFLDGEDATDGLSVRLVADVSADASTGQLTTTIVNPPPIPFTNLDLHLNGGVNALLANGLSCGTATTTTSLGPTSGLPAATPSAQFVVDNNGSGGACPGSIPFNAVTTATLGNTTAGASNTLTLGITRSDGDQTLSTLTTQLPDGMLANLSSITPCSNADVAADNCPAGSQIGTTTVTAGAGTPLSLAGGKVYLTSGYNGATLGLAIVVPATVGPFDLGDANGNVVVRAAVAVDTVHGQITITTDPFPTILDGVPLRLKSISVSINQPNFITNQTSCAAATIIGTTTSTGGVALPFTSPATMGGCISTPFVPTLSETPSTTEADAPLGLTVDLHVPSGDTDLQTAVVTLPQGVSLNPSVAAGLQACTLTQLGIGTSNPACPGATPVGTVEIDTPLLPTPLEGDVYIGAPQSGDASSDTYRIYLDAENATYGISVRLAGSIVADPSTGQLTATFANTPPIPFTDLKLNFNGGAQAPLASPATCGAATTTSTLTPTSGSAASTSASYTVDANGSGGACPPTEAFNPTMSLTTPNTGAGAGDPVTISFASGDQQQNLGAIDATLPPGLIGEIGSVPLCSSSQAAAGTCSSDSQIGTATVSAGVGSSPLQLSGPVYLTVGPDASHPFGLSIAVPADAGPYTGQYSLGTVVVQAAIAIDPHDAHLTITSGTFPTILQGIPLRLKAVSLNLNRHGFMVNPTSCQAQTVSGSILSAATTPTTATAQAGFTPTGCGQLAFSPAIVPTIGGSTSSSTGASLSVSVAAKGGQGNLQSVAVTLPSTISPRLSTINQACVASTYDSNPSGCPAASQVGTATASTPVLPGALTGSVYLVAQPGAMPSLGLTLSGDGVSIDLSGTIAIGSSGLTTTFSSIPDVPISNFTLTLPQGPNSALTTSAALTCSSAPSVGTSATSHSGQTVSATSTAQISGCATTSSAASTGGASKGAGPPAKWLVISVRRIKRLKRHAVKLYVRLPMTGKLTLSSPLIAPVKVFTSRRSRYVWVEIRLTKYGQQQYRRHHPLKVKMRAGFRSYTGRSGWNTKGVTLL